MEPTKRTQQADMNAGSRDDVEIPECDIPEAARDTGQIVVYTMLNVHMKPSCMRSKPSSISPTLFL